jgi:hypothetical protein
MLLSSSGATRSRPRIVLPRLAALITTFLLNLPAHAEPRACIDHNNQGAEQRSSHHLLAARSAYMACVSEPSCPNVVRAECESALSELKTAIPSLSIAVVDDLKRDVAGAEFTLDGKKSNFQGVAIEVDPGAHELAAARAGDRVKLQLVALEGEQNRRVELTLPSEAEVERPTPPRRGDATAPAPPATTPPRRSLVPVLVMGGVALAGAASFGYFALSGKADVRDLERCKPYCPTDEVRSARTKYLLADVSLGVSVLAASVGAYLLLSAPAPAAAATSRPRLALGIGPGRLELVAWTN